MTEAADRFGPVDVLIVEFPRGVITSAGFDSLLDLVHRQVIQVLDLEFVRRDDSGEVTLVDIADAVADAPEDLGFLVGASSGLLDEEDVTYVGGLIEPGSLAGVLLYEHVWMIPLADAIESGGAHVLSVGHLDPLDVIDAIGTD